MKYKVEYDENTNKIITDKEVSKNELCWRYSFHRPNESGYGVIATSREICIKKIRKQINDEVKDLKKQLASKQKLLRKLDDELSEEEG